RRAADPPRPDATGVLLAARPVPVPQPAVGQLPVLDRFHAGARLGGRNGDDAAARRMDRGRHVRLRDRRQRRPAVGDAPPGCRGGASRVIGPGDTAPDFALPSHTGEGVRLYEVLEHGPAVVFFYPRDGTPL